MLSCEAVIVNTLSSFTELFLLRYMPWEIFSLWIFLVFTVLLFFSRAKCRLRANLSLSYCTKWTSSVKDSQSESRLSITLKHCKLILLSLIEIFKWEVSPFHCRHLVCQGVAIIGKICKPKQELTWDSHLNSIFTVSWFNGP